MPLSLAPVGKEMTVTRITADERMKHHLGNLGILVGATVESVRSSGGDLILKIKDGRIALNRGLAMKIFVA